MPSSITEMVKPAAATTTAESAPLMGSGTTNTYQTTSPTATDTNNNNNANANNDEYIISLIRRHSTNRSTGEGTTSGKQSQGSNAADGIDDDDDDSLDDDEEDDGLHEAHQTTYSQTLIHLIKGYIGCGILSLPWAASQLGIPLGVAGIVVMSLWSSYNCWTVVKLKRYIERTEEMIRPNQNDQQSDDGLSSKGGGSTTHSAVSSSNITYPDVGEWAHGVDFQKYIAVCICTQQLAICTVFMSFVGENLYAVLQFLDVDMLNNHGAVISATMPAMMALSFLPSLKSLAPVMLAGTVLIMAGFSSLGVIGAKEWESRPDWSELPTFNPVKAPMALCGILYSFEGICIILPVESAMKEPKGFQSAFCISMSVVTMLLCGMAGLSILAFGDVTNGSITAFLLEEYKDDEQMKFWLMMSNLLVSLSIIFTYPLQLFPAVELVAPMVQEWYRRHKNWWIRLKGGTVEDDDESSEHDLEGFEPMGQIPEHEEASLGSLPSQHEYGADYSNTNGELETAKTGGDGTDGGGGGGVSESASLSRLSSMGYQSVVDMMPEWQLAGDSPALRASLVLSTYVVAMVVPNVESLVSLAGAIAGSSTALLIPPILELAWIRHMEKDGGPLPDWEGGPTAASKTTLVIQQHSSASLGGGGGLSPTLGRQPNQTQSYKRRRKSYLMEKIVSWVLLILGLIFAAFGSYFSVQDIVKTYAGKAE
mmetsp:Transcript_22577/g.39632  ORF Transcript_22577/g.39632 Transcript_22577/m.39632 type:complete len:706 (-) Transcript_22577:39-2156(-)